MTVFSRGLLAKFCSFGKSLVNVNYFTIIFSVFLYCIASVTVVLRSLWLGGVQPFVRTEQQSMLEVTFDRSLEFRWRYGNALSFFFLLFGRIDCDLPLLENRVYYALGAPAVPMKCMGCGW